MRPERIVCIIQSRISLNHLNVTSLNTVYSVATGPGLVTGGLVSLDKSSKVLMLSTLVSGGWEAERPGTAVFAAGSRDRDWDLSVQTRRLGGCWAETQTETRSGGVWSCVWLSLAAAGPVQGHPPTQGQLRLRLRHSDSLSAISCEERARAAHVTSPDIGPSVAHNIGLKFRLRCAVLCSPWPQTSVTTSTLFWDQTDVRMYPEGMETRKSQDPEDKERGCCLARGEYVSGFTCSWLRIQSGDNSKYRQGRGGRWVDPSGPRWPVSGSGSGGNTLTHSDTGTHNCASGTGAQCSHRVFSNLRSYYVTML